MTNSINETIAIIDSGIGGVSILKQLINNNHCGNFIYFADNLYMPYGNKNKNWLKNRVHKIIDGLKQKYNVTKIIIACNTASASIGKSFDKDIVKLDFLTNITYYATPLTKKSLPHINVIADKTLARQIEQNILNKTKLMQIVKRHVKSHGLDKLNEFVLGCTHYELIRPMFEKFCPTSNVINNSSYVIDNINIPITNDVNIITILSKKDKSLEEKIIRVVKNK